MSKNISVSTILHQWKSGLEGVEHNIALPLLINLCSTLTIMSIVIKNKMNIRMTMNLNNNEIRTRKTVLHNVLIENREMISRPAVTLVPSIFSLFSLPLFIISLSLGCQNLENDSLRHILIVFYFLTFIPQIVMFHIYIYPSSYYWKQWQSTKINQQMIAFRQNLCFKKNTKSLSMIYDQKTENIISAVQSKDFSTFLYVHQSSSLAEEIAFRLKCQTNLLISPSKRGGSTSSLVHRKSWLTICE
ncbi:hypothetical protein I4U23_016141 [Adineta vaga]|nr:hypothetical protein I4U23_016141 [Adineta vaga]